MKNKVYLAGGFKSDWSKKVKKLDGFVWFDPKDKERPNGVTIPMTLNEYGTWDLHHIKQCDIVFVYIEKTNPSCFGLSVEAGFAKGLGKTVILVLEPGHKTIEDRYMQFVRLVSDITFESLEEGIDYLKSYYIL